MVGVGVVGSAGAGDAGVFTGAATVFRGFISITTAFKSDNADKVDRESIDNNDLDSVDRDTKDFESNETIEELCVSRVTMDRVSRSL